MIKCVVFEESAFLEHELNRWFSCCPQIQLKNVVVLTNGSVLIIYVDPEEECK